MFWDSVRCTRLPVQINLYTNVCSDRGTQQAVTVPQSVSNISITIKPKKKREKRMKPTTASRTKKNEKKKFIINDDIYRHVPAFTQREPSYLNDSLYK